MDVGASLWPTAVRVQLGDWEYEIPPEPASVWITAIAATDGGAIIPGLLEPEDQRLVWRDFVMGRLGPDEVDNAWREVVTVAAGRPWWEACRLVLSATAKENWSIIHGKLVSRGVDLEVFSLGGFCNVVHLMALQACADDAARSAYEFELSTPPPGVDADEAHDATGAAGDFLAAMQQFQQLGGRAPRALPTDGGPAREIR